MFFVDGTMTTTTMYCDSRRRRSCGFLFKLSIVLWLSSCPIFSSAFIHPRRRQNLFDAKNPEARRTNHQGAKQARSFLRVARYGPPSTVPPTLPDNHPSDDSDDSSSSDSEQEEWERADAARVARQEKEFQDLVNKVLAIKNPDHLPSLMTKHMDLLLRMRGYEGVDLIQNSLRQARLKGGEQAERATMDAIEFILSFAEEFVEQAQDFDSANKMLLGKIIRTMTNKRDAGMNARDQEELLDELMEKEKSNFTPGFLRHVEGECERIASAPVMTPQSSRLLEIMRIIQARVLEELGKDMGEGALVLGQLLGYEDTKERLAVLDAGLMVRGVDFAHEMVSLTEEALDGFQRVPGGADPELVERVAEIHARIGHFIQRETAKP